MSELNEFVIQLTSTLIKKTENKLGEEFPSSLTEQNSFLLQDPLASNSMLLLKK